MVSCHANTRLGACVNRKVGGGVIAPDPIGL